MIPFGRNALQALSSASPPIVSVTASKGAPRKRRKIVLNVAD
jgi:hypothetical protein